MKLFVPVPSTIGTRPGGFTSYPPQFSIGTEDAYTKQ
jgi:hypothetical protein